MLHEIDSYLADSLRHCKLARLGCTNLIAVQGEMGQTGFLFDVVDNTSFLRLESCLCWAGEMGPDQDYAEVSKSR